jgi:hypothetical protein
VGHRRALPIFFPRNIRGRANGATCGAEVEEANDKEDIVEKCPFREAHAKTDLTLNPTEIQGVAICATARDHQSPQEDDEGGIQTDKQRERERETAR